MVWIGFGVAGVGAIIGGITGGMAIGETSAFEDDCPSDVCSAEQRGEGDMISLFSNRSNVSSAMAGVGVVTGAIGRLMGRDSDGSEEP